MLRSESKMIAEVDEVHFRDLETLETWIHSEWSDWGSVREVSPKDIGQFAELTSNKQWIHTDQKRAREESPYGDIISHGFFNLALIPSLMPLDPLEIVGHDRRIARGSDYFRFPGPVYPNDLVHARSQVTAVIEGPNETSSTIITRSIEVWPVGRKIPAVVCSLMFQYF